MAPLLTIQAQAEQVPKLQALLPGPTQPHLLPQRSLHL